MTEDDKFRIELHRSDVYYGDPLAADRIEELLELNQELTLQLLAVHGQAADALDKLAKAVAGLRKIAAYTHIGESGQGVKQHAEARIASAALAELEGK